MSNASKPVPAPEAPIWQGRSSQWTNFIPFALCVLILPIPWAAYRWLATRCTKFVLTSQRLRLEDGILSRRFDDIELYRVKDITLDQPFIQRLVGLGTIRLLTSDASHPTLTLPAIASPMEVRDTIRQQVELMRRERGVRELDVSDNDLL
ncbi:MAG TPA: hypothetical protein DEB06_01155 [Phycisphaerales bacterium]|nr:hypothetical protein [Phycisphaerales bacterium]